MKILVIGYGNPGRLDDGLGPAFAEQVQALSLPDVTVESNYQLNVEDAELISGYEVVIFADASLNGAAPFEFRVLEGATPMVGFSSHSITAESLLGLAGTLFNAAPKAYAMAIRGYAYDDFGLNLSDQARGNLDAAVAYISDWIIAG